MIKDLSKLLEEKPKKYAEAFLENCTIEEKMDSHYITIKIMSPETLAFYKRNMKPITNVDCILNRMYTDLISDWYDMLRRHKDEFAANAGKIIKVFYFPTPKPISTLYDRLDARYVLDPKHSEFAVDDPKIAVKRIYRAEDVIKGSAKDWIADGDPKTIVGELYDKERIDTFASKPEGYVFRYGKGSIYQVALNRHESESNSSHFYYEYALKDFITYYMSNMSSMDDLLDSAYVPTVCKLFNAYMDDRGADKTGLAEFLDADTLEPPFVGEKPQFNPDIIPNARTRELCAEDLLNEQIFKILLVNLRNRKTAARCYYLTEDDIEFWNGTVDLISKVST